jgi:hypothetical protein
MSNTHDPYLLRPKQQFVAAMAKDGGIPEDVQEEINFFLSTRLAARPTKCGYKLKTTKLGRLYSCEQNSFTMIYEVIEDQHMVVLWAVKAQ